MVGRYWNIFNENAVTTIGGTVLLTIGDKKLPYLLVSKLTNQSSVMKISGDYRWYKETLREIKKIAQDIRHDFGR